MDRLNEELTGKLAAAVRALDARAGERAARVDAGRVAGRVLERLRREGAVEPRRVWGMSPAALRVAAAALIIVAGGVTFGVVRRSPEQAAIRLPVAIPVDSLSTGQLESVLQAAGEVRASNFVPVAASNEALDSLSEQQLQKLLTSLEDVAG